MHNNPVIMQLVSDPSVNDEYSQKISELDRRLKMNNLSYEHWDTLNDRQRETFVLDLFMDGDSASSIENYVENAYHNCDCPDVVDDLEQDSPALMARIQNAKAYVAGQPAPSRPVQFESLLNEMIDNLLTEQVPDAVAAVDPSAVGRAAVSGVELSPEQRYENAKAAVEKILDDETKGKYKVKEVGAFNRKLWTYTDTLGPRGERARLVQAMAKHPAFAGAKIKIDKDTPWAGLDASWPGLKYGVRLKKGSAKGIGNKGDILEGIMATAFYMRFLDPSDDITATEAFNKVKSLESGSVSEKVMEGKASAVRNNNGKDDKYFLHIALANGAYNDMIAKKEHLAEEGVPSEGWMYQTELEPLCIASAQAVDIPGVKALAKSIAENDQVDEVEVKAVGPLDQSGTKADLKLIINGAPAFTYNASDQAAEKGGEQATRAIGAISLKYNSKLLGQTGKGWLTRTAKSGKVYKGIWNTIKNTFGVDVGKDKNEEWTNFLTEHAGTKGGGNKIKAKLAEMVMQPVFDRANQILKGKELEDNKAAYLALLDGIEAGVRTAATGGEKDLAFLTVGKDKETGMLTAKYLDWFEGWTKALRGDDSPIDLEVHFKKESDNPMLLFYDANKGGPPRGQAAANVMFSYRCKTEKEGKTTRTYIEYGDRLKELIEIKEPEAKKRIDAAVEEATEKSDKNVQEESNKKPGSLLEFDSPRKLPSNVQAYEQKVLDSMKANGILGKMEDADSDANGPDAEMVIGGKTHYIEVKLNMNAQMGDKTIKYFPSSGEFQASDKFDDDTKAAIENGMKQIEDDVVNFINFIEDDRYEQSSKWRKQKGADPLGSFATTLKKWRGAIENKLYNKITTGFGKDIEDPVTGDTIPRLRLTMKDDFISQMYASKKLPTYYIQVGGLGLYRLGAANPANLPVPVFKGVISLETRPKPSGGEKELDTEKKKITVNTKKDGSGEDISFLPMYAPERDKDGNIQYRYDKKGNLKMKKIASGKTGRKGEEIPDYEPTRAGRDEGKGEFFKVTGAYMGTARFRSPTGDPKDIKKSPYTLDDPESIAAMLKAMGQAPEDTESEDS